MKVTVSEIPNEGLDFVEEEALELAEVKVVSPVRLKLRVEKVGNEVIVNGSVSAVVGLACSRCLKDFRKDFESSLSVVYHPVEELKEEEGHEVKTGELDIGFYSGDELDISELLKEQILLGIPIKPLCKDSCKGICIGCGADLNETACKCDTKGSGSSFDGLKNYFIERRKE